MNKTYWIHDDEARLMYEFEKENALGGILVKKDKDGNRR
jgi:hypothetical protein